MTSQPGLAASDRDALRRAILAWFDEHGRRLAFRSATPDPWAVLLAEVMAQQTQVSRVDDRWQGLLATFPTPAAMAAATPAAVIRAWRGLGYNRRALDLHRAAVAIVAAGGRVPDEVEALQALPGIGPYTARAVAAIAFGRPVGAVDVNVRRVVGRISAGGRALPVSAVQALADELVDRDRPGAWTHAVMDVGATICRPARPACPACPARPWCLAARPTDAADAVPTFSLITAPAATPAPAFAAAPAAVPTVRRPRAVPFEETRRWLRGRIVDRLRDAPPGVDIAFADAIGPHPPTAVAEALAGLARDGIVDLGPGGLARLPGGLGAGETVDREAGVGGPGGLGRAAGAARR